MTTGDEVQPLVTWHTHTLSDALDAKRLRPISTGGTAPLNPRRVWH
jgi:hypothetical protein